MVRASFYTLTATCNTKARASFYPLTTACNTKVWESFYTLTATCNTKVGASNTVTATGNTGQVYGALSVTPWSGLPYIGH